MESWKSEEKETLMTILVFLGDLAKFSTTVAKTLNQYLTEIQLQIWAFNTFQWVNFQPS